MDIDWCIAEERSLLKIMMTYQDFAGAALTLPLLMILITMFIAILYFLRSRGMSKKVPPIIGNYRRNILSLREIYAYFVIFFVNFYLNSFLLKFHMQFGLSIDMIRIYGFSSNLVFNNLLEGIILPIFILWNLNDQMPDSILKVEDKYKSTKPSVYNLGYQNLEPRRMYGNMDSLHSKDKVYVNSTNNFSFLNATNKNPSIVDLPSVVWNKLLTFNWYDFDFVKHIPKIRNVRII